MTLVIVRRCRSGLKIIVIIIIFRKPTRLAVGGVSPAGATQPIHAASIHRAARARPTEAVAIRCTPLPKLALRTRACGKNFAKSYFRVIK